MQDTAVVHVVDDHPDGVEDYPHVAAHARQPSEGLPRPPLGVTASTPSFGTAEGAGQERYCATVDRSCMFGFGVECGVISGAAR